MEYTLYDCILTFKKPYSIEGMDIRPVSPSVVANTPRDAIINAFNLRLLRPQIHYKAENFNVQYEFYEPFNGFEGFKSWQGFVYLVPLINTLTNYKEYLDKVLNDYFKNKSTIPVTKETKPNKLFASMQNLDPLTEKLMANAVPQYRNTDICPVPNCNKQAKFIRFDMVCEEHGPFLK